MVALERDVATSMFEHWGAADLYVVLLHTSGSSFILCLVARDRILPLLQIHPLSSDGLALPHWFYCLLLHGREERICLDLA